MGETEIFDSLIFLADKLANSLINSYGHFYTQKVKHQTAS